MLVHAIKGEIHTSMCLLRREGALRCMLRAAAQEVGTDGWLKLTSIRQADPEFPLQIVAITKRQRNCRGW